MSLPASESVGLSWSRLVVLGLAVTTVSALHYFTNPSHVIWHAIYQRLYYVPLLLGAAWFGVRGGLLVALVTSVAYLPHVYVTRMGDPAYASSRYVELAMFWLAALLFGALFEARRRLTLRYQAAAASLQQANRALTESQAQLRQADRLSALGQMAAGLAHEIRNPLGGLKGALEIIESRVRAGTPEAEFTHLGRNELSRLEALVADFLAYARPRPPQLQQVDLRTLLQHVVTVLGPQAERRRVRVQLEAEHALPAVVADGQQLEQVFVNVVLNAVEAGGSGGRVRITARPDGQGVAVDVADSGPGIPPDQCDRVFEPFFTTKDTGTGLGLAVSARIVAAHGGDIAVVPQDAPGTRIRIRLPLQEHAPLAVAPAAPNANRRP